MIDFDDAVVIEDPIPGTAVFPMLGLFDKYFSHRINDDGEIFLFLEYTKPFDYGAGTEVNGCQRFVYPVVFDQDCKI